MAKRMGLIKQLDFLDEELKDASWRKLEPPSDEARSRMNSATIGEADPGVNRLSQIVTKLGLKELKVRTAKYRQLNEEKIKIENKIDQHHDKISENNVTMQELEDKHLKQVTVSYTHLTLPTKREV